MAPSDNTTPDLWFPCDDRVLFTLTGSDAERYLNSQVTTDIRRLSPAHSCLAALCTPKGKLCADLHIARHGDTFWIDAPSIIAGEVQARLDKYLVSDDAILENQSSNYTLVHALGSPALPPTAFQALSQRYGHTGYDFIYPAGSRLPADPITRDALETLRIETGTPAWGREMGAHTLPPEMGEERWISYTKGCYVGQETIARLKSMGHVNQKLVGLAAEPDTPTLSVGPVLVEGKPAGSISSATWSSHLQNWIALSIISRQYAQASGRVETSSGWARITPLPFIEIR